MTSKITNPFAECARKYRDIGWSVFPVREDGSKQPYTKWASFQRQLPSIDKIKQWEKKWPKANLGVATGKKSGIVVLDFDSLDALDKFEAIYGKVPDTISQTTGREGGGKHLFFAYPKGANIRNDASGFLDKVDVRAEGGYAVVAPSIHKTGRQYKWDNIDPLEDGLEELLELPERVVKDILEYVNRKHNPGPIELGRQHNTQEMINRWLLTGATEGERNNAMASLMGHFLYHNGGNYDQAYNSMFRWNKETNKTPMPDSEVAKTCKSIYKMWKEEEAKKTEATIRAAFSEVKKPEIVRSILNVPILESKIQMYPDGERRYVLKLGNADGNQDRTSVISMSAQEFISVNKMDSRMLDILGRVLSRSINAREWKEIVDRLIAYMDIEYIGVQDSDLAQVYDIISKVIKDRETAPTNLEALSVLPAVLIDNMIITSAGSIEYAISSTGAPAPSRRELADKLGRLGFRPCASRPRVDGKRLSTREMSLSEFMNVE